MSVQERAHAVHRLDDLGPQNIGGRPVRRHLAFGEDEQSTEVVQRKVQVVKNTDHRQPLPVELLEKIEKTQLV